MSLTPLLEVLDGGIGGQRSSIQHRGGGPGQRFDLGITPLVSSCLPHSSLFGPFLGLTLLGGVGFSSFHHFLTLLLPFSF